MEISITLVGFKNGFHAVLESAFRKELSLLPEVGRPMGEITFFNHPTLNNPRLSRGYKRFILISPAIHKHEFRKIKGVFKRVSEATSHPFVLMCHESNLHAVAYKP